jgi:hypothetical protein
LAVDERAPRRRLLAPRVNRVGLSIDGQASQ